MKIKYIKTVGKIPKGRVVECTHTFAKNEVAKGLAEFYDGDAKDGDNPDLVAENEAKALKSLEKFKIKKQKKETEEPITGEPNQDEN